MPIESALDEFQLPFAKDERKAIRLLAPAGSGKTHSLLWRCVHQWEVAEKTKPRFLIFTFTRPASEELRDRLKNTPEFRPIAGSVEVTTLNAWGFRRLKSRSHNLRLLKGSSDIFFAVHNNLQPIWSKHKKLDELLTQNKSRNRTAKAVMAVMDGLKSLGFRHDIHAKSDTFNEHAKWLMRAGLTSYLTGLFQTLADLEIIDTRVGNLREDWEKGFLRFWRDATVRLYQMAMITFEDQKYWAWLDLEEAVAEGKFTTGMHRYEHILVDEFQDVNCLDLRLLQSIAKANKTELTIIGDDDQAIYEWRGASPQFVLSPDEYIGGKYATHVLSRNYRSPKNVVEHARRLIKNNLRRVDKKVISASTADARLECHLMPSLADSIDYVVREVRAMLSDKEIKKVAILGRKRGQIIPYQIVLASHNIPFYAAEDLQVFLSEAFGDLKFMLGVKARAGLSSVPGLDPIQDLLKLVDKVRRFPLSKADRAGLHKHLQNDRPKTLAACVDCMRRYRGTLKGSNDDASRSQEFADAISALIKASTVAESIDAISDNFDGLRKDYGKSLEDVFYTDPPFAHLAEFAERYGNDYGAFYDDLDKAIATLARVPGDEEDDANREPEWKLPLHLMTALRAKGKEFDAVILLDVNEGVWPSKLATTADQLEQERRVFYVAFTRARKRLILLTSDTILGEAGLPSTYLAEMGLEARPFRGGK
ncbi:MAG: ATP-dependent helicase [Planctomycetes bacterium]|nr:ATP-dependent helicase [Planctomycetota bacterium]